MLSIAITAGCLSKENVASTPTTSTGGDSSGGGNGQPVIGATTPTPGQEKTNFADTDWQKKLENDRNDPVLAERINRLEGGGKTLMPIDNLPQEIYIGDSVYITGLTVNNGVSGFIENRGEKALYIDIERFTFITKDYIFATYLVPIYIDGQYGANAELYFKPGQKKSFSTINTKDVDGYKKIGGLPEDLKQLEQLLAQSSYLQIDGISVSDT